MGIYSDMGKIELLSQLSLKKKELLSLRFKLKSGSLSDTSSLSKVKKDVARILTFLNR